jgi:hypothetical protein
MQPTLQPAPPTPAVDPHSDPHDAIVALMRGHNPQPRWSDPSELNITAADEAAPAMTAAPQVERALAMSPPLNDKIDIIPDRAPQPRAGRGLLRFVLTVCAGIAATIGWQAYGDEAQQMFASVAPQLLAQVSGQPQAATEPQAAAPAAAAQPAEAAPAAQPATDTAAAPAQPAATAPAQAAATAAPPPAGAQPAAAVPAEAAPAQAAVPPEATRQLEDMSREIATLKQTIEQLRAEKQQMSRDAAARDAAAKAQDAKRKTSTQTPKSTPSQPQRAAAAPSPQPVSTTPRSTQPYPQQQTYSQPQAYPAQRQTYGQAQAYPPQQTYGQTQAYPPPQTYGQAYPQVQRDEVYVPPPRTLPAERGFEGTPRPPMPLQ